MSPKCYASPAPFTSALQTAAVSTAAQHATLRAIPGSWVPVSGLVSMMLGWQEAQGPGPPLPWLPCLPAQLQGPCVHLSSLHGHFSLFRCRGWRLLSGWEASGQTAAPSQRHPLLNLGCLWPATQSVGVTAPDKCCGFPSGCPQMSDPGGRRPPIYARCATPAGLGGDWGVDGGWRALCPGSGPEPAAV